MVFAASYIWKKIVVVLFVLSLVSTVIAEQIIQPKTKRPDHVNRFFEAGKFSGSVGAGFNLQEYEGGTNSNPGLAWGFINVQYVTEDFHGFRVGAWWIGVHDIWENHDGNYEAVYTQDSDLHNLYGEYQIPSSKTILTVGRSDFIKNPSMDGDSHQGVQLVVDDIPHVSLKLAAINRWTKHSCTDPQADGILGWYDVDESEDFLVEESDAGDIFYAGMLSYQVVEPLSITLFSDYQSDVMLVYGGKFDTSLPVNDKLKWDVDGIFARYNNQTPDAVADYSSVNEWLIHTSLGGDVFSVGVGWFAVGRQTADTGAGMFNNIDPLQNDDIVPQNPENDVNLYYIDSKVTLSPVVLTMAYGHADNRGVDCNSDEIDIFFTVDITQSITLDGYITWMNFDSDAYENYFKGGTTISYHF